MSMNVYGLIQSVIKKPGGPRSRFYLHLLEQKRAGIPTLFVFSLEKVNQC